MKREGLKTCNKWSEMQEFVEKQDPNKVEVNRVINILNDNAMAHFQENL